jgi:hypothetical protein
MPRRPPKLAGTSSNTHWHPPLGKPAKQIRLLYLFSGAEDEDLELELASWDIDLAPPYAAISYAWGRKENHRVLYVNGTQREVWPNCHYAIWQVRLHHPGSYIWIDAICIDQENLDEKSHQVAMMGNIYKNAITTLACIGCAEWDNDLLANFISAMGDVEIEYEYLGKQISLRPSGSQRGMDDRIRALQPIEDFWQQWRTSHYSSVCSLFFAIRQFTGRSYWKRLWIMQELTLSRSAAILFGRDIKSWHAVRRLYWMTRTKDSEVRGVDMPQFAELVGLSFDKIINAVYLADTLVEFECTNIFDRIFGTLSIIKWPSTVLAIVPDYNQTPLQLAAIMTQHIKFGDLYYPLEILELTSAAPEMAKHVRERQQDFMLFPRCRPKQYSQTKKLTRLKVSVGNVHGRLHCSLSEDLIGKQKNFDIRRPFYQKLEKIEKRCEASNTRHSGSKPQRIYAENSVAAVGCSELQEGDFLALLDTRSPILLALRRVKRLGFEIIGQAFLLPGFHICREKGSARKCACLESGFDHDERRDEFTLELSNEDMVVLAGQDFQPGESLGYDLDARFERLVTRVSERLNPMAHVMRRND